MQLVHSLALFPGFVSSVNQSDPARWTDGIGRTRTAMAAAAVAETGTEGRKAMRAAGRGGERPIGGRGTGAKGVTKGG